MSVLAERSYQFALRIVKCGEYLQNEKREFILSRQLLRSGTAIGALIAEGKYAQSKADFVNKLSISLKEANETKYWLHLLKDSGYLQETFTNDILNDLEDLISMLVASLKTAKRNIK